VKELEVNVEEERQDHFSSKKAEKWGMLKGEFLGRYT